MMKDEVSQQMEDDLDIDLLVGNNQKVSKWWSK